MKNCVSKSIFFLMMMFLLVGMTGCMNKKESIVDKMITYMNTKYDDHFEYSAPFGGGPDAISKQIIVKSEKYPNAQIWVGYYTKEGKDVFADNYVSYKYEEQTRNALQSLLENVFGTEIKLRYGVVMKGIVNSFTNETSFDEFISDSNSDIRFTAFILDQGTGISIAENELRQVIEESGYVISGLLYITSDKEKFEKAFELSNEEFGRIPKMQIIMDSPCSFLTYEWR